MAKKRINPSPGIPRAKGFVDGELSKELIFTCTTCGKEHYLHLVTTEAGGVHARSARPVPFRLDGTEGAFCNITCAIRQVIRLELAT